MNENAERNQASPPARILVVTGHDYRSRVRAGMHFVLDELQAYGQVRVFTPGVSELLRLKRALPADTDDLVYNRVVDHKQAKCFVWRTLVHPFNPRLGFLHPVSAHLFAAYRRGAPQTLRDWAQWADVIIVQSGFPVLFLEDVAAWNPDAKLIYYVSDALETIGCDPYLVNCLERAAPRISWACMLSPKIAPLLPAALNKIVLPQGVDPSITDLVKENPYPAGKHAVSIGSMLFDPDFFRVAADAFPDVTFHIIGSQSKNEPAMENIRWYDTMAFSELPNFIKHADVGIAPYRNSPGAEYLSDTSLKLIQYGMFGVPSVCPEFAAGGKRLRYGYLPGDRQTIIAAMTAALSNTDRSPVPGTSWREVARRVLYPEPK